ncbi:MAG: FecR domain-containing protein [Prolixibacteraceae bacterium]
MTKELLIKFMYNHCTSKELDEVVQWIDSEAFSDESKSLAHDHWRSFKEIEYTANQNERFNLLLDKIHHKINISKSTDPGVGKRITLSIITTWLTRAAAILLIPVLMFLLYTYSNNGFFSVDHSSMAVDSIEIIAPAGARTVVQLSDGTEVHLNYGSKIKYPRDFKGNTRELKLSGEGFFDVAHNSKRPFIVKAKGLNIKALGTKFNVLAYPDNNFVGTTLIEGKVVLEQYTENELPKNIGSLVPGEHIDYNVNTGTISITKGNVEKYIAWIDGLLVFDNSSIQEVAERLERIFNVDIVVSPEIKDFTYTVKFVDESISQILDLITKATPVKYKIFPREKLPDGTYSKQKIVIERK